jgi:hypothetical protein
MIPLHLGHLPWYGQALVLVLAFGPFVLLGLAIWVRARQDAAAAAAEDAEDAEGAPAADDTGDRLSD